MDDQQVLQAGEPERCVDRVGQGRVPDDQTVQAAGVLPHGGRQIGQRFGVEAKGFLVVFQIEPVRVADVGTILGLPDLLRQKHLVGGAGAKVVVNAPIQVEARALAVGQALERRGDQALRVGQARDVQDVHG